MYHSPPGKLPNKIYHCFKNLNCNIKEKKEERKKAREERKKTRDERQEMREEKRKMKEKI